MGKYQKNIEAARRISVMQYLETYHPGELVRKTNKEYCTKTHSSLVITPSNGLFHWFSMNVGGNNAIDYLTKALITASFWSPQTQSKIAFAINSSFHCGILIASQEFVCSMLVAKTKLRVGFCVRTAH